jgi:hypothetical protein
MTPTAAQCSANEIRRSTESTHAAVSNPRTFTSIAVGDSLTARDSRSRQVVRR